MKMHKSVLLVAVALLLAVSMPGLHQKPKNTPEPTKIADGGAPLPPIPWLTVSDLA